jgi:hypothetical protein
LLAILSGAEDAVHCAQALQRAGNDGASGEQIRLRVGLDLGDSEDGRPFALWLRDAAAPGEVLACQALADAVQGLDGLRFRERDPIAMSEGRGLPVFSLESGPTSPLSLLTRPPFVGRKAPLRRLEARVTEAREGRGGVVFVRGEPGIGKTRLLEEFAARAHGRDATVLAGRCVQGESSLPYGPIAEALSVHVRRAAPDSLGDLVDAITTAVAAKIVPELRERLPELPEPAPLRPNEERQRLRDAIAQLLAALARHVPVVLLLDDLHWGDAATLGMLLQLAQSAAGRRLLLVGAYRDEEIDRPHPLLSVREALAREPHFEELALAGLEPEPVRVLLEAAASRGVGPDLLTAVQRATNGNPLFVRELLLQWEREGRLRHGLDTALLTELELPQSVRAIVEQRLSKLSTEAQHLLTTASAFHGLFHFDATVAAAGLGEEAGLDALDEALEAQLIRSGGGADEYEFSHALIRQALYDEMTPGHRLRVHRQLADEMSQEGRQRSSERAAEIAEHYHRSRELPGADAGTVYALAGADRAESGADFDGVARFLRMALDLLPADDDARPFLLARLGLALAWSGANEDAARVAGEAGESIARAEGPAVGADYLAEAADAIWQRSYNPLAWRLASHGLRHAGTRRDWTWVRLASHQLLANEAMNPSLRGLPTDSPLRREVFRGLLRHPGHAPPLRANELWRCALFESRTEAIELAGDQPIALVYWIGDYRNGVAAYRARAREAVARGEVAAAALLFATISLPECALGELAAADESVAQAVAWSQRMESAPMVDGTIRANALERARIRGVGLEDATARLTERGDKTSFEGTFVGAQIQACLAPAHALLGRYDEALRALERSLPAIDLGPGWAPCYPATVALAVETLWTLGVKVHLATIERCLRERVLRPDFRFPNVDARLSLARLCALDERWDEAVHWFSAARGVLDEQGARPLRAITDFDEAWMHLRRGARDDRERALPLLDNAWAQFESIGMQGWARRAEALSDGV